MLTLPNLALDRILGFWGIFKPNLVAYILRIFPRLHKRGLAAGPPQGDSIVPNLSMAIANEFLRKPGALGVLTQMQLQKLTYIAHGWNLALNETRLVTDPLEAWDYGPVFPMLYDHAKYFGKSPISRLITERDDDKLSFFLGSSAQHGKPYTANLSDSEHEVINRVWDKYKNYSAFTLSDLTHKPGTPWYETYFGRGKNAVIVDQIVQEHYLELARSGARSDAS